MNDIAGKIAVVIELYECGMLCKCHSYDLIEIDDPCLGLVLKEQLRHEADCAGRDQMKRLLDFDNVAERNIP